MADFAAIESRLNAACTKGLSNAVATIGSVGYSGIYEASPAEALEFVAGTQPRFKGWGMAVVEDDAITIATLAGANLFEGTVKRVDEDGTGWQTLLLEAE